MTTNYANNIYFPSWNKPIAQVGHGSSRSINFSKNSLDFDFFLPRDKGSTLRLVAPHFFFNPAKISSGKTLGIKSPKAMVREATLANVSTQKAALGSLVLGVGNMIADLAGKTRKVYNRINSLEGVKDPVGLVGLGWTSIFSIVSGVSTAHNGYCEERLAKKIGDVRGRVLAGLKASRATVASTASVLSLPAKVFTLTLLPTTSGVIAAAASVFSTVSGALFSTLGLIYFMINSIKIHLQREFDQELGAVLNHPGFSPKEKNCAAFEFLQDKLRVSDQEMAVIRANMEAIPSYQGLLLEQKEAKIKSKITKLGKKKEAELARATSSDCVDKIKKAELSGAAELIDAILCQTRKNRAFNALGITINILGISAMVIGMACTGPIPLIITGLFSTVVTVGLFLLDLYYLIKNFQQSHPGRYDKLCLLLSSILGFGAATAAVYFSMNPIAIACAATFGLVSLTINLACYWRLCQLEALSFDK